MQTIPTSSSVEGEAACQVRKVRSGDYGRIAILAEQLGYPSCVEDIKRRITEMADLAPFAVYVAEDFQLRVIGWVGVFISTSVVEDKHAEISALIVEQTTRCHGVGAKLLLTAEEWARTNSCQALFVRSNVIRERAHQFYLRHAYQITKSQRIFVKTLESA